jgi:hypothetical protein
MLTLSFVVLDPQAKLATSADELFRSGSRPAPDHWEAHKIFRKAQPLARLRGHSDRIQWAETASRAYPNSCSDAFRVIS